VDPDYDFIYYYMGSTYHELGVDVNAIACYQKAIEKDPKNAHAYNNLGYLYCERGDESSFVHAIHYITKAVMLNPKDSHYLHSLGYVFMKYGVYDKAMDYMKKAIELTASEEHRAEWTRHLKECERLALSFP
jgi:Tfp pilus assembly protein PilF